MATESSQAGSGVGLPRMSGSAPRRPARVVLYSHDTCGLGHVRRNLLIARTLAASPLGIDVLMISGASQASAFELPHGVDVLSLPGLFKQGDGRYRPRRYSFDVHALIDIRARAIQGALETFRPDVFVVDNVPLGAMRELEPALKYAQKHSSTRCVLGLRDVLDHPDAVAREWRRAANLDAIRDYYDAVWVYGDPGVYAAADEYGFPPDVQAKLTYLGYLDPTAHPCRPDAEAERLIPEGGALSMCVMGGGQDGMRLAGAFALAPQPRDVTGLILTGPFMDDRERDTLERLCNGRPRISLARFVAEPMGLYRRAERVVSMGGYNTVGELLALGKRPLIVPRVKPRQEQLIRAQRLSRLGLADMIHPAEASPAALARWLRRPLEPSGEARGCIDLGGLGRVVEQVGALVPAAVSA